MKPVYQKVIDKDNGDCMQAVMASLLELPLEEVPEFITFGRKWFSTLYEFVGKHDFKYDGMVHNKKYQALFNMSADCFKKPKFHSSTIISKKKLYKENGINGFFFASVLSPKYADLKNMETHAVICDKDYNIIHDPNPNYKNLIQYPLANIIGYNGIVGVCLIN